MLASDVNNPEFVNPSDPDSALHVDIYWHEPIDKWASEEESQKQGRPVVVKRPRQPFIRIMTPADRTSILEVPLREDHKARFPKHWLNFQLREGMLDEMQVPGWKLEEWPHLKDQPEMLREFRFNRFQTVEQVAGMSDAQVQKIGIGGLGLREQARVDLRGKLAKDVADQVASKDHELAEMRERMAKLEAALMNQVTVQPAPDVQPVKMKRKYTKKAKTQEAQP